MDEFDIFIERLAVKMAEHPDLNDQALSKLVAGKDLIRDVRRKRLLPNTLNLAKIAEILGTSSDWLLGKSDTDTGSRIRPGTREARLADVNLSYRGMGGARDLPIYGTARGHDMKFDGDGSLQIEQTILDPAETIRYVERPPALTGVKSAYCVYVQGDSMAPRWEAGDLAVVDPRKPPNIGDDVIVQLLGDRGDEGNSRIVCVLIKRLVRRSGSFIELLQYQPDTTFRVDTTRIAAIHRIVRMGDLLGA